MARGTASIGTDAFQECDTTGITMPVTKHNELVLEPERIPGAVAEAFHIARSGTKKMAPMIPGCSRDSALGAELRLLLKIIPQYLDFCKKGERTVRALPAKKADRKSREVGGTRLCAFYGSRDCRAAGCELGRNNFELLAPR